MKKVIAVGIVILAIAILAILLVPRTGRLVNPASPRIQAEVKLKEVFMWYSNYTSHGPRFVIPEDLNEIKEWSSTQNRAIPELSFQIKGEKEKIRILYIKPQDHTENELVFVLDRPIPVAVREKESDDITKELRYIGIYEDFTTATMESEPDAGGNG